MPAHPSSLMPPSGATKGVELIGHRGAKREFPENSLRAFARALERGADAVELDVHATADGVAVVHHDAEVRVPRGRALRPISEMSWAELSRVELSPEVFVPSLEQVLDAVSTRGTVYVELKGKNAEEPAIAVIQSSRTRCAVHSFDHGVIARAARLAPELRRGILFDEYPAEVEQAMRAASALDVWPQWELIDAALVDRVHANGGRVIAWTVNTTAAARKLVGLGVDG